MLKLLGIALAATISGLLFFASIGIFYNNPGIENGFYVFLWFILFIFVALLAAD